MLSAWVAGLAGFLVASQAPPTFEATSRLLVGPVNADLDTVRASEVLTPTYAELAVAEPLLSRVIAQLDLDLEAAELKEELTVTATSATRVLVIRAANSDADTAAAIANTLGEELVDRTAGSISRPEGRVQLIDPAIVPADPVAPNVMLITILSALAGLLIAALVATAIEYFSNTVKASEDLVDLTGATVLGEISTNHGYRGTPAQPLVVEARPESKTALGYRLLASRLPLGDTDSGRVRSIVVVGSQVGEPIGEFTSNLAAVLARTGRTVTLVDADDYEAQVTRLFMPEGRSGLSELLALAPEALGGMASLESIRVKRAPNIELVPAGSARTRTVREDTLAVLVDMLTSRSDLVIVSAAPIHRSAQALLWARHTDGVILVAGADSTRVENLRYAVESLRLIHANTLGSVLLTHGSAGSDRLRRGGRGSPTGQADVAGEAERHTAPADDRAKPHVGAPGPSAGPMARERPAIGDDGLR